MNSCAGPFSSRMSWKVEGLHTSSGLCLAGFTKFQSHSLWTSVRPDITGLRTVFSPLSGRRKGRTEIKLDSVGFIMRLSTGLGIWFPHVKHGCTWPSFFEDEEEVRGTSGTIRDGRTIYLRIQRSQ